MEPSSKIKPEHLRRRAYVYVRQSTEHQVLNNLQSQQRQYELADRARSWGWQGDAVETIDDDLGRSGSSARGRTGFARLVAEVALGKAGIIFGLEVSRLARNNRDWYQLLDLCSLTGTLIADADGVYDPAHFNDRLLLGLKGTMSEAELHILKGRMLAGLQHKAQKGELKFHLPAGYQFDEEGRIVKAYDEQVVHLLQLVFSKIFVIGSVSGLLKYLLEEGLLFPRKAAFDKGVRWVHPYYKALYDTLTNPLYAGAYVYGRSKIVKEFDEQGNQYARQKKREMKDWEVVLKEHHPAYISWEDFLKIRKVLQRNQPAAKEQASTAVRAGEALLQGLARCGKCGRAMRVRYNGKGIVTYPYYVCPAAIVFGGALCQSVGGRRIDEAISTHFLEEMTTARMEIHMEALRQGNVQQDQVAQQLGLELERVQYQADRIARQYDAIEPENRLVARTLEAQWNEALRRVEEVKDKIAQRQKQRVGHLSDVEQEQIKRLAHDLPALFAAKSTTDKDRKNLLRAALEEVQLRKEGRDVHLKIVWKGGAVVEKGVHLPKLRERLSANPDLIKLLRELSARHTDEQIARVFIRKGIKTPTGLPFTSHRVASLRQTHGIECYRQANDRGQPTYTVMQAAKLLQVGTHTIYLWLRAGILKGDQVTESAPWAIQISEEDRRRLTAQDAPDGWLPLEAAARDLGVSQQAVLNWVKAGRIPYVYVTKGRRRGLRIDVHSAGCKPQRDLFS